MVSIQKKSLVLSLIAASGLTVSAGALAQSGRDYVYIVGSSTVYPFATVVAERFGRAASSRRHGVSEAQSISEEHLRQCCLRAAYSRAGGRSSGARSNRSLEPCSALDPIVTARIEDLMDELCEDYAIVIVTRSMQQAARVSRRVAYFHLGLLVEVDETNKIFTNPQHKLTEDYITGRIG